MPAVPPVNRFTLVEVRKRLATAKEYLQSYKTQRTTFLAPEDHFRLPIILLDDYDCDDEYNFVSATELSEKMIRDCVKKNKALITDEGSYHIFSVSAYGAEYYDALQRLFSLTCFCLFDARGNVTHKAVLCLGSFHHAPRLFYRDSRGKFHFEKLPAYIDLR